MPAWVVRAASVLAFGALCALAYAPLADAGLSAPDLRALADAGVVTHARGLTGVASALHGVGGLEGHALPVVSLIVSGWIWSDGGSWPDSAAWPLRLENLVILLTAAVCLGLFVRRLLLPWIGREAARAAGLATALLLPLAPTAVTAVMRIPARGDLLALAFCSAAGALLLRGRQERQPALGFLVGVLAILAGFSSDLALGLPVVFFGAEFASARRWRPERVRWRTALITLVVFGACVGLQIVARAALQGRLDLFVSGTRLAQMRSTEAVLADVARSLERLGVLMLPVHGATLGAVGYVLAAAALLLALHPAFQASRAAPRLWGWLVAGWLAAIALGELLSPAVRVSPSDLSRADALVGSAAVVCAGLGIAATALSGARRATLPWLVAVAWAVLAHGGALAWREATRELAWLREDLEVARETLGRDALLVVLDPPGPVAGVDALQGQLAALLEPRVTGRASDPHPPRVRGATLAAFLALAREEELTELRRERVLISFPRAAAGLAGEGRLAVLLPEPEASGRKRSWRDVGRSTSDLDLEALGERALRIRATAEADTDHDPVVYWRAEASLDVLREGELTGVWRTRGPDAETPLAVFDLSTSLAWLLAGRVRQLYPREGWGLIEQADVLDRAPGPGSESDSHPPEVRGDDWRFAAPPGGFPRDEEGRDSWAVGLLDVRTWRHVELAATLDGKGRLVVSGAATLVADWLRAGSPSVSWSLEGRVAGVAVWRIGGRRVAAGER